MALRVTIRSIGTIHSAGWARVGGQYQGSTGDAVQPRSSMQNVIGERVSQPYNPQQPAFDNPRDAKAQAKYYSRGFTVGCCLCPTGSCPRPVHGYVE